MIRLIKINQQSAIENGINVGIKELAILDYFMSIQEDPEVMKIDTYFLPDNRAILRDIPVLKIRSPETIKEKINNLIEDGLLDRHPDYPAFLKFSDKANKYEFF